MNKTFGPAEDFALVKADGTRTIVCYDLEAVAGSENATWRELYFPKKQNAKPTLEQVKAAIIADINSQTDEKILTGCVWTPEGGDAIPVWLSEENQRNFSEAQRIASTMPEAILPVTFKLGEQEDGRPIYHEFTTAEELTEFYLLAVQYINHALAEGWQRKDSIDWDAYAAALDPNYVTPKKGKKSSK